jgi:hypothetical protein|tara:strand:- start:101 stop:955 length:855 start_codon:yes stop_codon:yes gene_type:complete
MPTKKTNKVLIDEYLDHIKKEKKLSAQTLKTYENISNQLPFNLLTTQPTIIKKIKELYDNPNTKQLFLNIIILVRRFKGEETDKLIKYRNALRDDIVKERKKNLDILDDKLPTLEYILSKLENLSGKKYILNYLMIEHGLRNKDLNMQFKTKLPEKGENNYITLKGKNSILQINDYKTEKSFGQKEIKINNKRFIDELKKLNLQDGDYILPKKNGDKINSISTFNEKILRHTIDDLGQNKLVKIKIKDLLNKKDYDTLEKLSNDRGTSMSVLLKSYNLENGISE